ncbi:MAG: uroporphyrinogen III decarboxylase [Verrucomicrobia bacterium]|nr:MAG: uroporphyrinogen III decarboxylase [Verrucomicrobiota bacterium]
MIPQSAIRNPQSAIRNPQSAIRGAMSIVEKEFLELTAALDPASFWMENEACEAFTEGKPRCFFSFSPDDHWLFEFLDVESTVAYYRDKSCRDRLHREANQVTLEYVGKAFFSEDTWFHEPKRIENLFGSEYAYLESGTPWLQHVTEDPAEFADILDRAERTDLEAWALSDDYRAEWTKRAAAGQPMPALGTGSRGPATIMTSVLNPEILFIWAYDHPDLIARFSTILARKMVELNQVFRRFSGNLQPGWWITDDNSALFSPTLYREYCYPVLEYVLDELAPGDALRYQHSDSAMGHLMDQQRILGINQVNYGPEIDVGEIRKTMPDAMILGQMPPFLLRNAPAGEIRDRVKEDFAKAGRGGGLHVTTAGSLAAGTGVGRMRWMMQCAQEDCRYR